MAEHEPGHAGRGRPRLVAACCFAFIAAMVGVTYASVPLYAAFCSLTGFGGATRVAVKAPQLAPGQTAERAITIRFDANVAAGLPWTFTPDQREMVVKIGASNLAHYSTRNTAATPTAANATYNVSPPQAGAYFVKLQCFCFEQQTLAGHEQVDMPVVFYVDPAILDDPDLKTLPAITLSYTFFPAKVQAAQGTAQGTVSGAGDGAGRGGKPL